MLLAYVIVHSLAALCAASSTALCCTGKAASGSRLLQLLKLERPTMLGGSHWATCKSAWRDQLPAAAATCCSLAAFVVCANTSHVRASAEPMRIAYATLLSILHSTTLHR